MSRVYRELTDEEKSRLDPTKAYHFKGETMTPEICGVLEPTGKWGTIYTMEVQDLRCAECGRVTDVSDYDTLWVGPDVPYDVTK